MLHDDCEACENKDLCPVYMGRSCLLVKEHEEELGHSMRLHDHAVRIIKDYREKHGEPPASMMAVYEYLHKKNIEAAAEVKMLISN